MFVGLFALFFVIPYISATKLPSYIRPCGRKEPNYEQCILENVKNIKDKICTGIPELNVSPIEPLLIEKLVIYDTPNIKMFLEDGKIRGFCDFVINSVHADPDKLHFEFNILIKHFEMEATYDCDIRLLTHLAHKGTVNITSDNTEVKQSMDFKEIIRNGKKRIYASKMSFNLNLETVDYKFDESQKELAQFYQIVKDVVNQDKENIIKKLKPTVEEIFAKEIIAVMNEMLRNHFEALFPDRTKIIVEH
ncbi:PREDICTED: uncharacterized protein LOC105568604 [Vollenhovia emeryi]|uniref:uncharacterized protein LOC105568604 n=1 Tax=Vollenhovia emeryi TaxID=411798 RepID=UPI0005F4B577|nr:PREDICTED: uncharacterized protein LOC105568604 [Vollenhovia emeryi]